MTITISSITRKDVPRYIEFLRAGFGEELSELGTDLNHLERIVRFLLSWNEFPLKVIKRVSGHEAFALLARKDGEPIGCLTVIGRKEPSLTGAYVLPEFRGQGIAMHLVEAAVARLRAAGYERALASPLNHVAQRLIESVGFTPINRTVVYAHPLPLSVLPLRGVQLRRMHRRDLPPNKRAWRGRRYNVRFFGRLLGIRIRGLTAVTEKGAAVGARLFAISRERVGEVYPLTLIPGEEHAILSLLAAGERWFMRMGKEEVNISLDPEDEALGGILHRLGFTKKREWVEFALDLSKSGRESSLPPHD